MQTFDAVLSTTLKVSILLTVVSGVYLVGNKLEVKYRVQSQVEELATAIESDIGLNLLKSNCPVQSYVLSISDLHDKGLLDSRWVDLEKYFSVEIVLKEIVSTNGKWNQPVRMLIYYKANDREADYLSSSAYSVNGTVVTFSVPIERSYLSTNSYYSDVNGCSEY